MEKILENIKAEIEAPLHEIEVVVDHIEYVKQSNLNFLRIYLDKVNGIDLDDVVAATEIINPILDKLDLIEDSYILDVLSKERGN